MAWVQIPTTTEYQWQLPIYDMKTKLLILEDQWHPTLNRGLCRHEVQTTKVRDWVMSCSPTPPHHLAHAQVVT